MCVCDAASLELTAPSAGEPPPDYDSPRFTPDLTASEQKRMSGRQHSHGGSKKPKKPKKPKKSKKSKKLAGRRSRARQGAVRGATSRRLHWRC
jgi:hypothetical protein